MLAPWSVAMFRPEGKVPQIGLASKGPPIKWPPNMKTPYFTWQSIMIGLPKMSLLPKMRRLSKIGILVILGALLCIPGGNAHLGIIDTLSSSFTGPCIYDGAYGKPNPLLLILMFFLFHPYDVFGSILKQLSCNILESLDDPVFTYSGGSSTTMTPASCLAGQYYQSLFRRFLIPFSMRCWNIYDGVINSNRLCSACQSERLAQDYNRFANISMFLFPQSMLPCIIMDSSFNHHFCFSDPNQHFISMFTAGPLWLG